jgi:hypothetical protein
LTLTDSIQLVSNSLYARRGLIPATPMLHLAGEVESAGEPRLEAAPVEPAALSELDRRGYGFDRAPDHEHWSRSARATLWLDDERPVAYSYAWPHGRVGPLAARDGPSAGAALAAELARLRGLPAEVVAPGTSTEIVETALSAGLRFTRPPGLLLLSRGSSPPRALAISGYSLY